MNSLAQSLDLSPLPQSDPQGPNLVRSLKPLLASVNVRVSVRVGEADATVEQLLEMKGGSILELDRLLNEPLDVIVDEHVVARGFLVAVGDSFGLRITETAVSALERA